MSRILFVNSCRLLISKNLLVEWKNLFLWGLHLSRVYIKGHCLNFLSGLAHLACPNSVVSPMSNATFARSAVATPPTVMGGRGIHQQKDPGTCP